MKICIVDSTFPINTRTKKIEDSLVQNYGRENIFVIAWNRDNCDFSADSEHFIFNSKAAYGSKIQKLSKLFAFKKFMQKTIAKLNCDYILASHWDVLFLASMITKKKNIIYEDLDIPTNNHFIILKILQLIEKISLKKACCIIFASRFFMPLYNFYSGRKILLENKPDRKFYPGEYVKRKPLVVSFLGVIRYAEILKNLISAASGLNDINIKLYGSGPELNEIREYSKSFNNVEVLGRYENSELQNIYNECDVIWAAYPSKDYNVKYAISNKFHESLALKKPAIYSDNTELGLFAKAEGIGFVINPYSVDSIRKCLIQLTTEENIISNACDRLKNYKSQPSWNDDFKTVISFLDNKISNA